MKGTEVRKILKDIGIKEFAKVDIGKSWNYKNQTYDDTIFITVSELFNREDEVKALFPNYKVVFDYWDYRWFDGSAEYHYEYGRKCV